MYMYSADIIMNILSDAYVGYLYSNDNGQGRFHI